MPAGRRGKVLAIGGLMAALGCGSDAAPERIVLIVVDTLRADFASCCGARPETPVIDALAARGQRFERAVGSFHQTTMSMGALFTGRTPSFLVTDGGDMAINGRTWCGMARFAEPGDPGCLPRSLRTLPQRLRQAGYETLGVVSNELLFAPSGFERGFDEWVEVSDPSLRLRQDREALLARHRARQAEAVNEAVSTVLSRRRSDHFFLYVHYMDVHDHHGGPEAYALAVERVDAGIGALLALLGRQRLLDDTVVVLTSDHGERLGEEHLLEGKQGHWGQPSFEEVLRVPLIVTPAWFDDVASVVRSQDLYGMLARIAGISVPEAEPLQPGELFLTEGPWLTYREGRWKSFHHRDTGRVHLVDLVGDPHELYDVAALQPDVVERHVERREALVDALATSRKFQEELTAEDEARLHALGYLE